MAKKNESISDKIVRLYKEGFSIPEIAKEMEMPKDNVPRILEKHFPDYASFVQPEREGAGEGDKPKKSVLNMSMSELFGRKKGAKQEGAAQAASKVTVNLAMDDDGFVDHSVAAIASMLQKGRSVGEIAGFFNKDPEDIKAVQGCMDEHFKRMNTYKGPKNTEPKEPVKEEEAPAITDPLAASLANGIAKRNSNMYATGIDEPVTAPVSAPVAPADDKAENTVHLVTPEIIEEENQKAERAEKVEMESVSLMPETEAMEEAEMPSIEPISLDEDMVVTPAPESTMPSIEEEIAKADELEKQADEAVSAAETVENNNEENSDMGMSPMEKMRMFAQEQIELNNKKIEELKASTAEAEAKSLELGKQATEIYDEIVKLQEKAKALNAEKEQADILISKVNAEIEGIRKENDEFKSYM